MSGCWRGERNEHWLPGKGDGGNSELIMTYDASVWTG